MELVFFAFGHLLVLLALGATAWSAGTLASPWLAEPGRQVPGAFRLALGLALLAQALLVLGLLGQLRWWWVLVLVVAVNLGAFWRGGVWGSGVWMRFAPGGGTPKTGRNHRLRFGTPPGSGGEGNRESSWRRWGWGLAAILVLPVFLLALYPPLGFDQTLYHLPFVEAFAATGGMPFLGDLRFPVFPQLVEVLQAALLLLAGEVATQLAGFLALLILFGLVLTWAREKADAAAGLFAVAMVAGSPCAVYVATCGYIEPLVALFAVGALYAAEKSEQGGGPGWALAAGFLAGSAAAGKYHGLFFLVVAGLLLWRQDDWRGTARRLAFYAGAALLAAGPSYARIIFYTGNPLFPFFAEIFGSGPWTEESMLPRGTGRWLRVATLLWDLSFNREPVGHLPPWSPVFLLALPMALWALRWPDLRRPALVALLFLLASPTHGHYFLIISGVWALVLGVGLHRLAAGLTGGKRILLAAAAMIALGGPAYAFYRIDLLGLPAATQEGRDALLSRHLPLYPSILFLNREAAGGRVFAAGPVAARMASYYDGTLLGDVNGVDSVPKVGARALALGSVAVALAEIRADWLLIDSQEPDWLAAAAADTRLELRYEDSGAKVYRLRQAAADGP